MGKPELKKWGVQMKAILWLIILVLAALGVVSIVEYFNLYDVPMIDVSKEASDLAIVE